MVTATGRTFIVTDQRMGVEYGAQDTDETNRTVLVLGRPVWFEVFLVRRTLRTSRGEFDTRYVGSVDVRRFFTIVRSGKIEDARAELSQQPELINESEPGTHGFTGLRGAGQNAQDGALAHGCRRRSTRGALGLERLDWPVGDPRWEGGLAAPLGFWNHWIGPWCHPEWDRTGYLNRPLRFGATVLHKVVTMGEHVMPEERAAFAATLLDAGARTDLRDDLLKSTPLGWACRWGREELVQLLLERGADPVEADAEPWATPLAWAEKKGHGALVALLRERMA